MPFGDIAQLRDLSNSAFPLTPRWEPTRFAWHRHYPDNVPPALEYPLLRAEQLLQMAAGRYPERMAIRYFRTHWTYRELLDRVRQVAANLQRLGLKPGDRALMVLPNCPEFIVAWFALHWLGVEIIPANPLLSARDLALLAEKTSAHAVFGLDLRLAPVLELTRRRPIPLMFTVSLSSHLPAVLKWPYRMKCALSRAAGPPQCTLLDCFERLYRPDATPLAEPLLTDAQLPAVLQPTGGTTGTPKIAVLTHANLQANVAQLHVWSGCLPGVEVVLAVLPFFHVFGATVALLSPIAGGSTLLLQARFCPKRIWKVMNRWQPGVAPMVPFMFREMCAEMQRRGRNITGLDYCFSGASPLATEVKEDFESRTGGKIFEGFGLSEASPVTHANPPNANARPGTIGLPLPGTTAKVVDKETGRSVVPPGVVGELVIRGPQVMQGYLGEAEETAQVLRDGWLYTGDLASMDADGYFTIVDRKKDMIISGGLNIYPAEVEEALSHHPHVAECAVVGLPDERYGERVVAYVVPAGNTTADPDVLKAYCKAHLAAYKVPRIIEVRNELPKNFLGKVRRVELRDRAA